MAELILYLGNKNYSSWSMRGWLALRQSGATFEERVFHLGAEGIRDEIRCHSPTGRVPALCHGGLTVWDSLAVAEYVAELFPESGLWPAEREARATARAVTAEMHSGFQALRTRMPFNVRRRSPGKGRGPGVAEDIERIRTIWEYCRRKHGEAGPFLFGGWCFADAAFAPVVSRFRTYGVEVATSYVDQVWRHPYVVEWRDAAENESAVEPCFDL